MRERGEFEREKVKREGGSMGKREREREREREKERRVVRQWKRRRACEGERIRETMWGEREGDHLMP